MTEYAQDLWQRAHRALETARNDLESGDCDASASRAYYAAFYAISAVFALEGRFFQKHSALEASLHRDLVNSGRFPTVLGSDYRSIRLLRNTGDYGGMEHVTADQAREAINAARRIIVAVGKVHPELQEPHRE